MPATPQGSDLPKLFRAAAIAASLLFALPGLAQETEPDRIAKMSLPELSSLADTILGSVGQDVRRLEPAAQRRDCPELTRAFNGFNLAYQMLGHADAALKGRPAREALPVKIKLIQSRVITFASRVRAEEWHTRLCRSYIASGAQADDPRYARPAPIGVTEFTQAAIEARQAAEANLATIMAAGNSKKCEDVRSAMQSVELFIPYLEKLALDISKRPLAMGPLASRRALEAARNQLVGTANRLFTEVGRGCMTPPPQQAPDAPAEEPAPAPGAGPVAPPGSSGPSFTASA